MKKLISLLLVGIMLVCALPVSASDSIPLDADAYVTVSSAFDRGYYGEFMLNDTIIARVPIFEKIRYSYPDNSIDDFSKDILPNTLSVAPKMEMFTGYTLYINNREPTGYENNRTINISIPNEDNIYDIVIKANRVIHGDINEDRKINAVDIFELKSKLANKTEFENSPSFDCYPDGKINAKDVLAVRKIIAGVFDYSKFEDNEIEFTSEMEAKIKEAYCNLYPEQPMAKPENISDLKYFGRYGGDKIVTYFGDWFIRPDDVEKYEVGGYEFYTTGKTFNVYNSTTGESCGLIKAYEKGWLSKDDIAQIHTRWETRNVEWKGLGIEPNK